MCLKCIRVLFQVLQFEVDILLTVALHLFALFQSLIYALSLFTTISAVNNFHSLAAVVAVDVSAVECQNGCAELNF